MPKIFLHMINMSISGSYLVLAVLLLRFLLKKAPKWLTVTLWGMVAIRLLCPFSLESAFSLIPSAEAINPDMMNGRDPQLHTGISIVDDTLNPMIGASMTPAAEVSASPLQVWISAFTVIWCVGIAALLIYTVISCIKVKQRIGTAVLIKDHIYQSEKVISPFVFGLIKPKIYLPYHISEQDMTHVIAHEQAHIRRGDHLWKPLGFLLLMLHWLNPLMWIGYVLLCRDIELACDERVVRVLDREARADYSRALLRCSVNRRMIAACPLAFGEVGVKARIKSVLHYKKPAFWMVIAAIVACLAVAVCFLTNPKNEGQGETDPPTQGGSQGSLQALYPEYFGLDASRGLDVYVWQMAKGNYSFGLLPHSEAERGLDELMSLKGVTVDGMRQILSAYGVDSNAICIIPWQNPVSSYIAELWIINGEEDREAKYNAYVNGIREMLFGETPVAEGALPFCEIILDPSGASQITVSFDQTS